MGKKVRLTESDLVRLVKRVILEQESGNPISFTQVVEVPNMPKDKLFDKIKLWLVESFNDFNSVSKMEDKSTGIFLLKPSIKFVSNNPKGQRYWDGLIDYTLKIIVKDNKFKVELIDFNHKAQSRINSVGMRVDMSLGPITDKENYEGKTKFDNMMWVETKDVIKNYSEKIINSIKNSVLSNKSDDFQP